MVRLSRSEISRIYQEGEASVIALVESFQDALASLEMRFAALEEQQKKNSKNSSKPPSSDGLRRTVSLREPTGKKPGGQAGHEGHTLKRTAHPNEVVRHAAPEVCPKCQHSIGESAETLAERRQVFDVPKVAIRVTEHQVYARRCSCCGSNAKASFPDDVRAPVQYGSRLGSLAVYLTAYHLVPLDRTVEILKELCGASLCKATVDAMLLRAYHTTEASEQAIVEALVVSPAVFADETGVRVDSRTDWIHVIATERLTHYHPSIHRGRQGHEETGILQRFAERGGILHTDFFASYRGYACVHAYCNAHLLRELGFLADVGKHAWAGQARTLLQETLHYLKTERTATQNSALTLPVAMLTDVHNRFDALVEAALLVHPRSTERAEGKTRGRIKQTEERLLLERLRDFKADILRFAGNPLAAFDNNLAERDLRMIKVQQKISGSFRSVGGAKVFCRLRGFCSTVGKQSANILDALLDAKAGIPFSFT